MEHGVWVSITDFGAVPGALCTAAVQAAFDEANRLGGCTVAVPPGEYIIGTVNMGSASLFLEKGAVLRGSPDIGDYTACGYRHNEMGETLPLLYSIGGVGMRLWGQGTINLGGSAFFDFSRPVLPQTDGALSAEQVAECTVPYSRRPNQPIFFLRCKAVTLDGLHITDSPCWTVTFVESEHIRMLDLTIDNDMRIPNNDGMHFCGCRGVIIRGCNISSGDDCIALSCITNWNIPCEDFVISDCILRSASKAVVVGYMHSIVRNVTISNIVIRDSNRGICIMASERTGLVENVTVSNAIVETRVRAGRWWGNGEPVFILARWHHYENYADPPPQRNLDVNVRDIFITSLCCRAENAIGVVGVRGNIQNVAIEGISMRLLPSRSLQLKGRVLDLSPAEQTETLPQNESDYWLLLDGARDTTVRRTRVAPLCGRQPLSIARHCERCLVETEG